MVEYNSLRQRQRLQSKLLELVGEQCPRNVIMTQTGEHSKTFTPRKLQFPKEGAKGKVFMIAWGVSERIITLRWSRKCHFVHGYRKLSINLQNHSDVRQQLANLLVARSHKWNFDFKEMRPMDGRWQWTEATASGTIQANNSSPVAQSHAKPTNVADK